MCHRNVRVVLFEPCALGTSSWESIFEDWLEVSTTRCATVCITTRSTVKGIVTLVCYGEANRLNSRKWNKLDQLYYLSLLILEDLCFSTSDDNFLPTMESVDNQEYVDAENGAETEQQPRRLSIPIKLNMDVNLGINLSIALILLIFSGLLFLPSKMLLDTSYEVQNTNDSNDSTTYTTDFLNSMQFQKRRLCPGLDYKYWMMSTFISNYDRNCTYSRTRGKKIEKHVAVESISETKICPSEKKETIVTYNYNRTIDEMRATRPKSISVTGHILAMMLIVSAVVAFVEVLRIRFINPKDTSADETAGSRKGSTVELMIQGRFIPKAPMRSQRSFELQGMHRSALRLLGARPPPLIRRSSFPTYLVKTMDVTTTTGDTPTTRSAARRPSVNSEALEAGVFVSALHRRARLIRRH